MARILFIDTSFLHTHVAMANDDAAVVEKIHNIPNEQSAQLNNLIQELLVETNYSLGDIDAIAINAGPGSYTGLRVGLGVAKGIGFALEKPLMLFDKLSLLTLTMSDHLLVLKARTGEGFALAKSKGNIIFPAQHIFYENFDWDKFKSFNLLSDDENLLLEKPKAQKLVSQLIDIKEWNKIAQSRFSSGEFDDLAYSEPFYLKNAFTTSAKKKI